VEVVLEPIREALPLSKTSPPRRSAPRKKKAHPFWFVPLIAILPPCLVLFILTPFSKLAACLAMLIGTCLVILAVIKVVLLYRRKNLTDLNGTLPWFLRGGAAQIISHIYHAFQYPKTVGVWVAIELFTILMTITGGVFFMIHKDPEPPNPVAAGQQFANHAETVPPPPSVTGDPTLDKALADLSGGNTVNWQVAADQLAKMKPDKNRAVIAQKLAERATTTEYFPRIAILHALGVWATPAEVPVLIDAIHDENNDFRKAAIDALGKTHDQQAVAPLVRAFVEGTNRFEAQEALRELGSMAEKEVLSVVSGEQDVFLRMTAINLIKEIGTQESLPVLHEVIAEGNIQLKFPAQDATKAINGRRRNKGK
jgi:hypothetical protein